MHTKTGCRVKTFVGLIGVWFLVALYPMMAYAESVTLAWDRNTEGDLAGYTVHIGNRPGTHTQNVDVGHVTTFTVSDLSPGETYYFAVTAYDIFANESNLSREIRATIPEAPSPPPEPAPTPAAPSEPLPTLTPASPPAPEPARAPARVEGVSKRLARKEERGGAAHEAAGRYARALKRYRHSLALYRQFGNRKEVHRLQDAIARVDGVSSKRLARKEERSGAAYESAGRYGRALKRYRHSLALYRQFGNRKEVHRLQDAIARVERLAR